MPENSNFQIVADCHSGDIDSEFESDSLKKTTTEGGDSHLEGKYGNGRGPKDHAAHQLRLHLHPQKLISSIHAKIVVILSGATDLRRKRKHHLSVSATSLPKPLTHPAIGNPTTTICTPNPNKISFKSNGPRTCSADNGNTM